ncbi:MAG: hypothetical protein U0270_08995 [Labilithrix sp.]
MTVRLLVVLSVFAVACSASPDQASAPAAPALPGASAPAPTAPSAPLASDDAGADAVALTPACVTSPVVRDIFESFSDAGTTTYFEATPDARGIVIALHGTGGTSSSLAQESVEWASFLHEAARRGYALMIPESLERTPPRQWDAQSETGDSAHIAKLVDLFEKKAKLPATTPLFIVGMSQGGGAAPIVAAKLTQTGWPVRAVGVYCAGGSSVFDHAEYTLPTTFSLMANDTVMTERPAVEANAAKLKARGVPVDLAVNDARELCPTALARIPGLDEAAARSIYESLQKAGVLDATGKVVEFSRNTESGASPPVPGLDPQYATFERTIREQLWVAMADHAFFGARNDATLSFFDAHR